MWLAEEDLKSPAQKWQLRPLEQDNDYSIHNLEMDKIVEMQNKGECMLKPYQKEEQIEEDVHCRWVFQRRQTQEGNPVYVIKLTVSNFLIRYDNKYGEVKAYRNEYYQQLKEQGQMN